MDYNPKNYVWDYPWLEPVEELRQDVVFWSINSVSAAPRQLIGFNSPGVEHTPIEARTMIGYVLQAKGGSNED